MSTSLGAEPPVVEDQPVAIEEDRPRLSDRLSGIRLRRVAPYLPVIGLMLFYTVYYSRLTVQINRAYGQPGFDFGIPDQGVWLLSRFKAPFVTIMGRNLFGDHTSFIFLLLVPLYWIYPHSSVLLIAQSALLALGALPIYLLARNRLASNAMATVLAGAFLLHPALQWGNLEQVHAEMFLVPLIGFAIYAAVSWRPWLLIVTVGLSLLVKEDVVLLILPLGLWVAWRRNRRFGFWIVFSALASALVATTVVIRGLLGVPDVHANRLPFGGLRGLITTTLRKPGQLFKYIWSEDRPFYVWQMIFPSALAFLIAPELVGVSLLVIGGNIVSNFYYQHHIQYHYSMALVPVLAMATAFAIGALTSPRQRRAMVGAVAACSLWSCYLWGAFPAFSMQKVPHWKPSDPQVTDVRFVQAALPPNAVVSAYFSYVTHVEHRDRAYQWPVPFKATYWGDLRHEGERLSFADQIEYLFLPSNMGKDDQAVLDKVMPEFELVRQRGNANLYRRRGAGP